MGEGAVGTGGRLTWELLLILIPDLEQNHFQLGPCNQLMDELKENVICGGKKITWKHLCLPVLPGEYHWIWFPLHAKIDRI